HKGKHDKDGEYNFQLVETDREFAYDENGRLLSSSEQEENSGLTTYEYSYDAVGNRLSYVKKTQTTKHPNKTDVAESALYSYNDSNQLVSAKLFDGKKSTTVTYTYDENGNLISEIGAYGTDQVETYYDYTVENRLQAVYDADRLLMAAAYDGDGNRVFQLNYNLHTDEDWKGNNGNGNGNNKDNAGSGNNGNGNSSSENNSNSGNGNGDSGNNGNSNGNPGNNGNGNGNSSNNGNGNGSSISGNDISTGNNGNPGNSGNGKGDGNTGNTGNGTGNSGNTGNGNGNDNSGNNGNGNDKENSKSEGTDDAGYGNATNAEEHNSQNQSGILFPVAEEISRTETDLIAMIKTTGKEKDYELIEYISNVNTQYTQVLMELNENGAMDAAYTYGTARLTEDRFTGESNFYLYDPSGNVAGITDQDGYLWQSYRYDAFGNATFGSPQYDNEYTFNGESYNPNIHSQYLRARYYDTVKGSFLTEDSYLGDIRNPLTLNRYSYCGGNPLFYSDPSGHDFKSFAASALMGNRKAIEAKNRWIAKGDKWAEKVTKEHQDKQNRFMDDTYEWLGAHTLIKNNTTYGQINNNFTA
ncbi:RHS repeat-associated core domain-containing protein, partial [Faecalibaculum rodentium]|uniref:RHS repeat-associated core domain-containing protein n=1 Tax=Faecalibaculum rodentium TaxID=1702221 RepID=UPI0025ABFF7C